MRAAVKDVAKYFPTAIISGRSRGKVCLFISVFLMWTFKIIVYAYTDRYLKNTHVIQVNEFVRLSELYYAGSHGMDIMGPIRESQSVDDHPDCIRTTDEQVGRNL